MAHSDLNELLDALLPMAEKLLTVQGEFYPIGVVMLSDGEIRHVGAKMEGDDHPSSQSLIDLLTVTFEREATKGKIRAAGICYDVLTIPPGKRQRQDAICFGLEHCLGEAIDVYRPYVKGGGVAFQFEDIFASKRMPQFAEGVRLYVGCRGAPAHLSDDETCREGGAPNSIPTGNPG